MLKLLILLLLSLPLTAQAGETRFFQSLYDIPIPSDLYEIKDMAIAFDKPHGRIAYAGAASNSNLDEKAILDFYAKTLPQMGWIMKKPSLYQRDNEQLQLLFVQNDQSGMVQFMLFPVAQP